MYDRLFPRWGVALFALLPLSELLYLPADEQTPYVCILACLLCVPLAAISARLRKKVQRSRLLLFLLALFSLWPLTQSLARMALFLRRTAFSQRPLWSLVALLTVCVLLLGCLGLTRCAMWALPILTLTTVVLLLSLACSLPAVQPAYWQAPTSSSFSQLVTVLGQLLPTVLLLALSLPKGLGGAAARGLTLGGALLALGTLRTTLTLGAFTAALLPYPSFSAAGLASLGTFAKQGEVFFALVLLLCELGRACALAAVLVRPFEQNEPAAAVKLSSSRP